MTWLMAGQSDAQSHAAGAQTVCAALGLRFVDLVASMDLMLTKPGYGSFAEAVANGVPVLSVNREAWPEEPWLLAWARERVGLREIDRACLAKGGFAPQIDEMLALPRSAGLPPDGVDGAAALLADLL
jgi:hypothetical protein